VGETFTPVLLGTDEQFRVTVLTVVTVVRVVCDKLEVEGGRVIVVDAGLVEFKDVVVEFVIVLKVALGVIGVVRVVGVAGVIGVIEVVVVVLVVEFVLLGFTTLIIFGIVAGKVPVADVVVVKAGNVPVAVGLKILVEFGAVFVVTVTVVEFVDVELIIGWTTDVDVVKGVIVVAEGIILEALLVNGSMLLGWEAENTEVVVDVGFVLVRVGRLVGENNEVGVRLTVVGLVTLGWGPNTFDWGCCGDVEPPNIGCVGLTVEEVVVVTVVRGTVPAANVPNPCPTTLTFPFVEELAPWIWGVAMVNPDNEGVLVVLFVVVVVVVVVVFVCWQDP
jgi:hypothetical protein